MFLVDESGKSENTLTKIPDAYNINLQTRFFVNDQHTAQSNVITASELFVDYSDAFKHMLDEANIDYFVDDFFDEID